MPTTEKTTIEQLLGARRIAETKLEDAKNEADTLRVAHTKAVLEEAFPQHTLAVFAHYWDEDDSKLIQLLSSQEDVADIELQEDAVVQALSDKQASAVWEANRAIRAIGEDDDILRHLDGPDEEHEDWNEFQLELSPEEPVEDAPNGK